MYGCIQKVLSVFLKKKIKLRWKQSTNENPRRHDCRHEGWGHTCFIDKDSYFEIPSGPEAGSYWGCHGHLTPHVTTGDEVIISMTQGPMVLRFVDVRNCPDPGDMFFATLACVAYLKDYPKMTIGVSQCCTD